METRNTNNPPALEDREAIVLAAYLAKRPVANEIVQRYKQCCEETRRRGELSDRDPVTQIALRWPFFLGSTDAILGIINPEHDLRRRLLIMTAILETTPEHVKLFLQRESNWRDVAFLFLVVAPMCLLKIILGALILSLVPVLKHV